MIPFLQMGNQSCTGTTSNPHNHWNFNPHPTNRTPEGQRGQLQLEKERVGIQTVSHLGFPNTMSPLKDNVHNKSLSSV